ncbi:PREDICTED: ribosome-recycling factor, mitochondrial [Polistes dominula]|uniref:Ribosome-recycling factor, mitochondrial n=1 Tax=Polistes dominula TaxID=743375 RepID=A0ABM1IYU8_POLDO|nr:PREDICTED: ribosome-recycling factor, mitochondrial [Polistes dominula]
MWHCRELKRCVDLFKSISISIMKSKHNLIMYSPRNNISHFNKTDVALLSSQYSIAHIEYCSCINRLENARVFSTTTIMLAKSKDRGKDKKKSTQKKNIDFREMEEVVNVEKLTLQLDKLMDRLKDNYIKNVSVRSAAGAIEELPIKVEGTQYLLQELVQINRTPKTVILNASAFPQYIPDIIQVLTKNQMNLNPQQDGTMIYIPIPKVTKEYRESLSKSAKSFYIKCRDDMKEVRNEYIKKVKNVDKLPQDVSLRVQGYIDTFINQYIAKAEQILETKQKELMGDEK